VNLLNPVGLLALLTIPPVVLLYLLRLRRIPVRVPSVLLWRPMVQDMQANQPFQRLRFSILLLLQIIILLLTGFAFTRPYYQSRKPSGRSVVVVLDASLSMRATDVAPSRFEAARQEALRIAKDLESGDEMMVVSAAAQTRVLCSFTRDVGALERAINSAQPSDCAGGLREALALCMSLARDKARTQVFILSDGGGGGDLGVTVPEGVEVSYSPFGERCSNVAITGLNVRETYGSNSAYELFVSARNYGADEVKCQVEVSLNGDLINVDTLTIPAGQQIQQIIDDPKLTGGIIEARLDAADDLAVDNTARIVFRERARRRVLLVSAGNRWFEAALGADSRIEASVLTPEQYDPTAPDATGFDVTVFDRWSPPQLPAVNSLLIATAPENGPVVDRGSSFDEPSVLDWDRKSPLLQYVDFGAVQVASMMQVEPKPWARGIVETAGGPLVVLGETETSRSVFLGFDIETSSFPARIAFPIFVRNAIQWLTTDPAGAEAQSFGTGSPVTVRVPRGTAAVTVRRPDGEEEELPVREPEERPAGSGPETTDMPVSYDRTEKAGIYSFSVGGDLVDQVALNVGDANESDLTPQPTLELSGGEAASAATYTKSTQEIWRWLIAVGLVVLTAEWLVYHRRLG